MPTYTYQCDKCGIRFDAYQKFTEGPLISCPECGELALRKIYQPVGIVFKGKGFYATDNRSPSGQSYASDKEEHSKTSKETKSDVKTDSKSDSKPEKSSAAKD